jgi:hypothetical protein
MNPLRQFLAICPSPLPLLRSGAAVVFLFLCELSGKLPYCHTVHWDSLPVHGLCYSQNCEVNITAPPPGTAGRYTLLERRWRCVQHFLFSCKASPLACPDPIDIWADLLDLSPRVAPACSRVRLALHVNSFDMDAVRTHCVPWLLDPFLFLQGWPRSLCAAVCSILAAYVLLVGVCVADNAVPAGARVFAAGLVHRSLCSLALPPASRVAGRCPPRSASLGVLRPKPQRSEALSPNCCFEEKDLKPNMGVAPGLACFKYGHLWFFRL